MTSSWFALETESRFCNSKAWVEVDGSMGVLKLYNRLYLSQIFHNTIIHRLCVVYYYSKGTRVRMPPQSCGPKSLSSFLSFYTSVAFFKCSGQELCLDLVESIFDFTKRGFRKSNMLKTRLHYQGNFQENIRHCYQGKLIIHSFSFAFCFLDGG